MDGEDDTLPPPRASPPPTRGLAELKDLLDPSTGDRLGGRRVMVPITTKAFFEGTLRPKTTDDSSSGGDGPKNPVPPGEERVTVNLEQGYLAEMSREDAAAAIDRRIAAAKAKAAPARRKENAGASKSKSKSKSVGKAQKDRKAGAKPPAKQRDEEGLPPSSSPQILPFFEIREEFDAGGNEIRSGAYNVAEGLEALQRAVREKADEDGAPKEVVEISDAIGGVRIDAAAAADDDADPGDEDGDADDGPRGEEGRAAQHVTDERFEELSSRLDDLARMEEEDERRKKVGLTSRRRIQGSAWGKGFLDGTGTKAKQKKGPQAVRKKQEEPDPTLKGQLGPAEESAKATGMGPREKKPAARKKNGDGWTKGFLNKDGTGGERKTKAAATAEPRKKVVAFGEAPDDVREIPRIGKTSVKKVSNTPRGGGGGGGGSAARPFERDAFSGVIKERPTAPSAVGRGQISERNAGVRTSHQESSGEHAPKKKLSRFAQQRQQLR